MKSAVVVFLFCFFIKSKLSPFEVQVKFFFSLFIFRGYSTREPASSEVTYFILRAYTGTTVSHRKNSGEILEKCS